MKFIPNIFISSLVLCVLFLYTGVTFSQNTGKITGKVTDKQSAALEADVKLISEETNAVVGGAVCDAAGAFSITDVPFGKYKLEVSFMGYSTLAVNNITLSASNSSLSFDTLKLNKQDITTDEIDVESEKGLIQFSADKKIFNVSQSILNKGGTAIDVLKKTPLVDVDLNDNVSLRGSQNVKILIDDKPSRYSSLKQIPAESIERIELITNPPAKYEAEGVTGLINIVMKKTDMLGFTGSVNGGGNYSQRVSGWGGLDLNLKKKQTSFFGNFYSGSWDNNTSYSSTTTYFNQQPNSLISSGDGRNDGYWIWTQGGFEYEIAPGKTIGLEGSLGTGRWYNKDSSANNYFTNQGQLSSFYNQNSNRGGLWENITGSLYFNNKLNDKGREITGDFTVTKNRNPMELTLFKQDYDANGNPTISALDQRDTTKISSYNINAQTDYTHPLNDVSKIEAGYKGTFRMNDNDFKSDTIDHNTGNFVTNIDTKNHFKLNEYINAVYATFGSSIKNFSYKLGVRLEQTNTKGELVTNGQTFKQNYFDYFPSVSLSQKIGMGHQLQLSYSRRITRPNIWRMNPFVRKFSANTMMIGNPELKPEFSDSYELSFMFYSNIITVTPLAFFRQNHDVITSYNYLTDSNITVTTFRNATGSKAYGLDLLLSSRALTWLNLNGTFSFYNTKFDDDPSLTDYSAEEGFSWKGNVRATFMFTGLFNLELYYNYTGKRVTLQGTEEPSSNFDIGVSKSFFNDALSVNLRAGDIFDSQKWGQTVNTSQYNMVSDSKWSARTFSLNLSFRFGNTDKYFQKSKKVKQNSNEKNDQNDGNGR